ncbi:hypothetical protein AB0J86_23270 [Micromonospora sp. NPDC049559]|uniref:hypothetical protein n=1 Tax=Micromonospora sp. NPDC049559 TaxID=3155923 RepID=UPI003433343E
MIPAEGGGSSGTNWYAYEVSDMWAMLKDQQTDNHWKQVAGWKKTYELTSTHLFRLKEYRDKLIEAWNPEKSDAAKAYVERLDYLIENVQQTYDVAIANYTTSSSAISAISMARYDLEKVYQEYAQKKQSANSSASSMPSVPSSEIATPTPSPSPGPSPTDQAELERLNNKARGIMSKLGGELASAQVQIKPPPTYKPSKGGIESDPDVYGGGGGGGGGGSAPPPIPPIMTVSTPTHAPSHGSMPTNLQPVPTPTPPSTGPILGGAQPVLPPPAPPITPTPPAPFPPTPPPPPTIGLPPIPPGPLPPTNYVTGLPYNPTTGPMAKPGPMGLMNTPRAMPPGGLIGGQPGMGLGQPGGAGAAARRINPIGGVIGGNGSASGMPMGGQRGAAGMAPTGRKFQHGEEETGQRWDPDNPWATDEGVAPVVLPSRENGRIDPGPAIGFDR